MKYTTFRGLAFGVGALLAVGIGVMTCSGESNSNKSSGGYSSGSGSSGNSFSKSPGTPVTTEDIMKMFESPSNGKAKLKDAFSGSAVKVNMYDDNATGKWMRAKVDYDRDEQDDEKWERDKDTGQITRVVSPNDDGNFGPKQTWTGSAFVQ